MGENSHLIISTIYKIAFNYFLALKRQYSLLVRVDSIWKHEKLIYNIKEKVIFLLQSVLCFRIIALFQG